MTLPLKNRKILLLAGFALAVMTVTTSGNIAHAEETKILDIQSTTISSIIKKEKPEEIKPVEPPKPVIYVVKSGDTLEKISKAHTTTWKRLWDKNTTLLNPDVIKPGQSLTIPRNDEMVSDRPLSVPAAQPAQPRVENTPAKPAPVARRGAVSGNTYTHGYCTWHVKNMRPDLPNNLGNANTWYTRYNGLKGSTPRVGAAGVTKAYMHVVYITSVNGNGTVNLSEMNYRGNGGGFGIVSTRTAPASEFLYIY